MRVLQLVLFVLLLFAMACEREAGQTTVATGAPAPRDRAFSGDDLHFIATVVSQSEVPPASGVLHTWMEYEVVAEPAEERRRVYMTYFGPGQELPAVGDLYRFTCARGTVDGLVGNESRTQFEALVVARFEKVPPR